MNSLRNNKGIALTCLNIAITLLILVFALLYFSIFTVRAKSEQKYECRQEFFKTQLSVSKQYSDLLDLNPKSIKIRRQRIYALEKLRLAMQSFNPPAITAAEANLAEVQVRQMSLDLQQKALLEQARLTMSQSVRKARTDWNHWQRNNPMKTLLLEQKSTWISSSAGKVPMIAQDSELAPIYRFDRQFSKDNPLESKWQIQTDIKPIGFAKLHSDMNESCEVFLDREGNTWIPKIVVDKF